MVCILFFLTFLVSVASVLANLYVRHSWQPKSGEILEIVACGLEGMYIGLSSSVILGLSALRLILGPHADLFNIVIPLMLIGGFIGTWICIFRYVHGTSIRDCSRAMLSMGK